MYQAPDVPRPIPDNAADCIREKIGDGPWRMWFDQADISIRDNALHVETASGFEADWIAKRFSPILNEVAVTFGASHAQVLAGKAPATESEHGSTSKTIDTARRAGGASPARRRRLLRLEDMEVDSSNDLAWCAAHQLVDEMEAAHLSPLFIHGPCGVGKTHLLQGICRRFRSVHPDLSMRYLTGEEFTNQFIQAVRHGQLDRFRKTMRRLHLLAIDDVHFVSGKTRTQEEVLHTLDAMSLNGARMVLASDAHPTTIRRFHRGLASRCTSGMLVRIDAPCHELLGKLAHRLASSLKITLGPGAADTIACQCADARQVQGLLSGIVAQRALRGHSGPLSTAEINNVGRTSSGRGSRPIPVSDIVEAGCEVLNISTEMLKGTGRSSRVVLARGLIAVLARELTTASYPELAEALGRKTHSSVHASVQRTRQRLTSHEYADLDGSSISLEALLERLRRQVQQTR